MVALTYTDGHTTPDGRPALFAHVYDALTGRELPTVVVVWLPDGSATYRDIEMRPIPAASLRDAITATSTTVTRV